MQVQVLPSSNCVAQDLAVATTVPVAVVTTYEYDTQIETVIDTKLYRLKIRGKEAKCFPVVDAWK